MVALNPMEVFDGVMLGDACLCRPYNYAYFKLEHSTNGLSTSGLLEYLEYVGKALRTLGNTLSPGHPRIHKGYSRGKLYFYYRLRTLTSPFFTLQYDRWYSDGKKGVPEDLLLSPARLAYWFMNDGKSTASRWFPTVSTYLCTQGYSMHSVELLEDQLHVLGLDSGRSYESVSKGSGIAITVPQDSVDYFMRLVDPYVTEPYRYKIKYRGPRSERREYSEEYKRRHNGYMREYRQEKKFAPEREFYNSLFVELEKVRFSVRRS